MELIVYAEGKVARTGSAVREAVMGPVAEFGAHLLVNVWRLLDTIDGDIGVSEHEGFEMLSVVDDVVVDEDLDAFL